MQRSIAQEHLRIVCPECTSILKVPEKFKGHRIKCPKCGHRFIADGTVPKPDAGERVPQEPARTKILGKCGYCLEDIACGQETNSCPCCGALHHSECWDENKGCSRYGCPVAPEDNVIHRAAPNPNARESGADSVTGLPEKAGTTHEGKEGLVARPTPVRGIERPVPLTEFFSGLGIKHYEDHLSYIAGVVVLISLLGCALKIFALMGLALGIPLMFLSSRLTFEHGERETQGVGKYYLTLVGSLLAIILSGFSLFS
jgi:hypothetical protein